jgi:hypothetical protein
VQQSFTMPSYSQLFAQAIAAAFATRPAAALAAALEVHLWKDAGFNPTPQTLLAAFTAVEADFTDYVAATGVVLTDPVNLGADRTGAIANVLFVITHTVVTQNSIYGAYLVSAGALVGYFKFTDNTPVTMAVNGDFLDLTIALPVGYTLEGIG